MARGALPFALFLAVILTVPAVTAQAPGEGPTSASVEDPATNSTASASAYADPGKPAEPRPNGDASASVTPGEGAQQAVPAEPSILGQVIVGFEAGGFPDVAVGATFAGFTVLRVVPQGPFLVVASPDVGAVRKVAIGIPGVAYVEDDLPLQGLVTPNDPSYGSQYGPPMMGFPAAWGAAGYGSASVKVAVIDSGLHRTHADFTPSGRFLAGYDYVNGDATPNDDCGHGTHVTGTVAATTNNGVGVAGMSQATILPLKGLGAVGGLLSVECSGSTSGIAQAILDASSQGADVISMSIGGGSTTTLENAVNTAWNNGVLLVAAAGNDGASNSIDYPGAYSNVIAVGALTSGKARASYSDMGPQLDIMAPGSGVLSTYNDGGYTTMDGTSMATPHVSGALAMALSCAPAATNVQVRNALYSTAEDLGSAGFDNTHGNGLARVDRLVAALCNGNLPNQPPTASFTHSANALVASFNGGGSSDPDGTITTYAWSFGDSTSGTGVSPSHTYASAGTYTVTLTVTDDDGATGSASQSVTVSTTSDPDPATPNLQSGVGQNVQVPAGQWVHRKVQVPSGATNLAVSMSGGSSGDADLYTRFGARPTSSTYNCRPYASGNTESCSHANPTAGWWYVSAYGYSGSPTVTLTATVTTPAPNRAPTASFTHAESGLTTSVNGAGSSDPDGDALTYSWTWGDGTAAGSGVSTSHAYASAGTRTVTLTVSDGRGGTHSTSQSVTVTAPANRDPTASFTWSAAGLVASFNGGASSDPDGDALSYSWSWGDGTAAGTGVAPSHTYASAGTRTVTLTVSDGRGGTATSSQSVTVTADPDPGAPTLNSGQTYTVSLTSTDDRFYKVAVPAGASQLQVVVDGPNCSLLSCSLDTDLFTKAGARPTDTVYDCRPYATGSDETCTHAAPASGWWYIRLDVYSGSGTVTLRATVT